MVWPNKPKMVLLPLHISKGDKIYYLTRVFQNKTKENGYPQEWHVMNFDLMLF